MNNFKKLIEQSKPPEDIRKKVQKNVSQNLGVMRFVADIMELYIFSPFRSVLPAQETPTPPTVIDEKKEEQLEKPPTETDENDTL